MKATTMFSDHAPLHAASADMATFARQTSFFSFPMLRAHLDAASRGIENMEENVQDGIENLPDALSSVHKNYKDHVNSVADALRDASDKAKIIRDKIILFNQQADDALAESLRFNDMIRKQNDHDENKLPDEMYEGSGQVVVNLSRAHNLGHKVLLRDAQKFSRLAKKLRMMYSQITDASLLSIPMVCGGSSPVRSTRPSRHSTNRCEKCHVFVQLPVRSAVSLGTFL